MLAHFSEIAGRRVVKQEFRIGRAKCERPECLRRDNPAADRFVEECAHRIKYRVASIVEVVLQLYSRNDHLLYRNPCADSSNYGDGKRLQCLDPQRKHRFSVSLTAINHGALRNEQTAGRMKLGNARCVRPVIAARRQTSVPRAARRQYLATGGAAVLIHKSAGYPLLCLLIALIAILHELRFGCVLGAQIADVRRRTAANRSDQQGEANPLRRCAFPHRATPRTCRRRSYRRYRLNRREVRGSVRPIPRYSRGRLR